jgi:hypothetical protein
MTVRSWTLCSISPTPARRSGRTAPTARFLRAAPPEPRPNVDSQLFDSLDPFPFREKDLDKEAEEFIVSWARELPVDRPLKIVVHLPQAQASTPEAHELGAALTRYFDYRARGIELDLKSGNPAVLFDVALRLLDVAIFALLVGLPRRKSSSDMRLPSRRVGRSLSTGGRSLSAIPMAPIGANNMSLVWQRLSRHGARPR